MYVNRYLTEDLRCPLPFVTLAMRQRNARAATAIRIDYMSSNDIITTRCPVGELFCVDGENAST
jgi:hypothetical protein